MLTMKWRVIVARTLILVMAGNPVIFAAHGMERTANEYLVKQAAEQRKIASLRQQLATAQVSTTQNVTQATAPVSTGVSLANEQQAGIKTSANGTTVIDIAAPSQRGVSHNRFNQFNVPAEGLILNNSKDPLISVLGGWTDGNRRLSGGTAGLILAEVTGTGRSSLLGYTEVLGDAAEFVLANPNGITCNGCGFINTPRVVLATGTPDLLNGELTGINVSGGDVRIDGAGLNAANVSKFDILTGAMQLNAALYADELNIRTGSNYYDFRTGEVQANADQAAGSSAYQFALDASALGAMYANSISLIGTEKGLGVRSDGLINSVNSLQLTADGQLQLKDTVAGGNLALSSQQAGIITSGTTYGQNVSIELAGTLHNSGVIAAAENMQVVASGMQQSGDLIAGVNLQGEWQQTASQQLNISGDLVNQGRIISQGQQTLAAAWLQNDAGALVQGDIANISSLSLVNQGIINSTSLSLATNSAQSSGHIQAQQLNIDARQFNLLDGMIYQSGADGRFNFSGENLLLAGGLLAADGTTKVNVAGEIQNKTNWLNTGNASISAANIVNSGTLQLLAGADVTADTLNNSGNMLFAGEQAAALNISHTLDNQAGLLQFSSDAALSGATVNNDGGQIYHLGQGELLLKAAGQLSNRSGEILSNGSTQLSAAQIENQQGTLSAEQLALNSTNINSQAGNIQAGLLDITAQQLNNQQGSIAALGESGQSLQLNISNTLDNSQGFILAKGQQLSLSTKQLINDQGSLLLSGADGLTINASGQLRNQQGLIHSGGDLLLNTPLLNNNQGDISARDINISAATLNNQQGVIGAQQVTLDGVYLDNRAGNIGAFSAAGHNLTLNFSQAIDNSAQGIIQSAADIAVITSRQLNNTDGNIVLAGGNGSLQVSATTLQNQQGQIQTNGQLLLTADNVQNQAGYIAALGDVSINAASINNSAGQILADKLLLNTTQLTNTDGMILVQNELNLHSPLLANLRGIISAHTLNITGNTLDNTGGQLLAAAELNISTGQLTNLDGVINSQQALQLSAAELNNRSGVIQGVNSFNAQVQGSTDNHSGQLLAGNNLQLRTGLLDNTQGTVAAGGQLNIHTTDLQNNDAGVISGTALNITATTLRNDALARIEGQHLQLTSRVIDNAGILLAASQQGDSLVLLTDELNNQGRIEGHGENFSLTNVQLNNQQGQIYHLGTGVLQLEFLAELNNSSGEIYSAGQLNIQGENINNSNGSLTAQQALLFNAAQLNNSEGAIQTSGRLAGIVTELNNQQGQLIAATDLQLAGTDISNIAGVIHAGGALNISGTSLINQGGKISAAGQSYQLAISDAIDNGLDGILTTAGNMAITAAGLNNTSGLIYQQGDGSLLLQVDNTLNNNDGTIAAADLAITTDRLNNNTGLIQGGAVDISTVLLNNNAGTIYQQGGAGQLNISSGSLTNDAGQISALADASISAGQLSNNAGRIESGSALHLSGGALNNDSGNLVANNITMQLTGALSNNQGTLFAADTLIIAADSVDNTLGTLAANADLRLTVATALTNNQGLLQAAGNLNASAQQIDNSAGTIQAGAAQLNAQQSINNAAGVINAQTLSLSTATLNNSYGVILSTDTSDNSLQLTEVTLLNNSNGSIASHGRNWDFTLAGLNNENGKLLHLGTGTFTLSQSGNLANAGTIASNANLVINAGNVSNSGTLQAQQQLQLNSALANQAGAMLVANNITLNAAGNSINNAGSISAANNLQLDAASVTNSHLLYAGNDALVNAANVSNSGTWSTNNLNVSGFNLLQNSGRIESNTATYSGNTLQNQASGVLINAATAANSLQLNVAQLSNSGTLYNNARDMSLGGNLSNSGSMIHAGTGNLLLGNNGSINNAGGSIASAGVATMQSSIVGAGTVYAEQGMLINGSGTFTNNSQLYTKGNMQVNSALHNQGGSLLSDGNLTINTAGGVTNSGSLQGQNLSLTSGVLNNNGGTITSTGTNNAQISAASLSNNGGVIQATNNNFSLITRSGELNNSNGQIKHGGNGVLTLQSASHLNQQSGLVQSAGQLVATAQGNLDNSYGVLSASQYQLNSSGTLNNNNGQVIATSSGVGSGSSSIQSGTLLNRSGHIAANGTNLTLNSAALDNDNGSILLAGSGNLAITASSVTNDAANSRIISNGGISLNSGSVLNNAGVISAANLLTLTGTNLTNTGTLASRSGKVDIDSSGTLTNSGTISGATAVELDVHTLNNSSGKVQSDGTVAVTVNSLSVGQIYGRDLLLSSNNGIALQNGELLSASRNLQLNSNGNITNSGSIVASGTLTVDAKELTNNAAGLIRSGGNAVLDLNRLTNNGIVSSNAVLTLNADDTTNTGTLAAGSHLDVNGNIDNRNLLFSGSMLTIDGNISNTANIYSNQDAVISGATVTNTGGTIAAARDLSISGTILNDHTGTVEFVDGAVTTRYTYTDNNPANYNQHGDRQVIKVTREKRTTTTYSAQLSGTSGIIASGRDMYLDGHITNNYSTISAGNNLVVSGVDFIGNSASNQQVHYVEVYEQDIVVGCLVPFRDRGCAEPGPGYESDSVLVDEYNEITYSGGSVGTVYAGNGISGSLKNKVELNNASPLDGNLVSGVPTNASGSSGSASRGSNAGASHSGTVVVNRSTGTSQSTSGANRSANGVTAGSRGTVDAEWRDTNAPQPGNTEPQIIPDSPIQLTPVDTAVDADNRQLNAGDLLHKGGTDNSPAQLVATQGDVRNVQVTDPERQQANALQTGIGVQGIGFMSPDMAASLRVSQGSAPQGPGQQQGGGLVGNGSITGSGDYNPDLIIKGLVDNQQGTLSQQQIAAQAATQGNSAAGYNTGQQAGQNVFLTDAQMRVLTEDLGFDANAINKGQQALYAAISQNDLLADGVTLSAGGTIDITADAGLNINSGISAGEGLILRSDAGLNMGNLGFFDSENLLGLQLGGDFTNTMNLQSDTLWLDIGGNFTNLGSLTGSDVLSISAGNDLINQNLLSGGHVLLNAGGDIINRTEFSQHTVKNGDNSTTYTTVGKAPQIISTDSLSMTAGNNIDLQGSKFSADGDISLSAGNDVLLGAVEKLSGHEKYFKGGYDIELNRTYDVVSFDAGGNLSVVAGNNLQSEGAVFAAAGDVELAAGNEMNLLGVVEYHEDRDKRTKKSTFKKTVYVDETYSAEHQGSVILAGGNVSLNAQQTADGLQLFNSGDVLLEGSIIQAGGNMVAYSGGELNIVSGEEWQSENHTKKKSMFGGLFGSTKTTETDVQYLGHAELNAAGDITLLAQQDINVLAGRINAGNIVAQAGFGNEAEKAADINILGDTETTSLYQENRRNGLALGFSDNFLSVAKETANENRTIQTDYVGSVFTATDNMALSASRDINVVGSELHAGNNLLLDAGRDINVATGQGSGSSYSHHSETKTGIAISADSNTASVFAGDDTQKDALTQDSISQTGSVLTAGNNVQLTAGNNLLVSGSDIIAGLDIRLKAVNDISIVSAKEQFNQQTEHSSIRDGLTVNANYNIGNTVDAISNLGQGGDATSIASSVMLAADTLNNAGPSAGAHLGQTTTTTTDTVQQGIAKGSSLTAGRDVLVSAGGDALFEGATVDAGRDLTVNAENISVIAAQNNSGSKHNTEYLQVGLNLSASTSNVSLTAGFSQADSELDTQNTDAVGSSLQAGNNVNLNASNDLHIIGSDINADNDVALVAGNDIVIKAAESQFSSNSEDSHLSVGAGINFGSDGIGFTANMAMGEGELDREGTNHSNSHITAGNNLSVTSGNDTTIAGGNLAATDVDMDIGGDLTVASVQDTSQAEGDRWDVSANITVGAGVSGGASVGYGETEGSSAWVNEQSSIIGSGSVNIRTEGHTQIDGAVIANIDENGNDAGNLTLDTGSLAYNDIADHDKEKSYYLNVGFTTGDDTSTNQTEGGTNYNASGNYSNHDKEQINRATVGEGNIVVRDNAEQDLSDLNRDTSIAQEVTKDDSKDVNLYASTTALDSLGNLVESPEKRDEQLNKWKDNVASIGSTDAWGNVAENATDALEDTYNAGANVATNQDLGVGDFWVSLDSTHKMTQLKNDLTRTAEGQALLERLKSDDPDERLAAQAELGHMAQSKFGIDPSDIRFYDGSETSSESLQDTLLADVKGATVTEQGHDEYGNIFVNVDNATDGKDMTNTLGHEVYETVTLQTGGTNDASQEAIAGMVGNQLANRIDQAMGGELANVGTGGLAGSSTVQQGTQYANAVGNAQVDYRQLQSKEMQAIKAMAPTMAEKEGITTEEAEKRMAEELLSHLDASWAETYAANGREGDDTALNYLAEALVSQGEQYDVARSDIPVEGMAAPRAEGQDYTAEEVKQHLIGFKDEHAAEYNNRTQDGEGLLATGTDTMFSEQWQFYNQNLATDKSLSDIGDTALGALTGIMDTGAGVTQGLVDMISNPWAAAEGMSHGLQAMIYDPVGTISNIFDQRSEGQINAVLDNLQGDYFGAGRTGMNTDLGFALDTGLLPVGKISGLGKFSGSRMGPNDGPQFPETFTTYRVEGTLIPNHRINIDVDGGVSLVPDNSNKIWLNFGQTDRATSYLARKIDAGLPGAKLKSFEVDGSFVLKLRQNAVPEQLSRQNPNSPIISADPFPDQFAVPKSYFDELIQSTIQGSGKNGL